MMDPDYDLFVDIVAAGSLSAAARMLNLSPASVSKRLSRLEDKLGANLIHRTTRRIALTAQGAEFHSTLLPIRAALREAEDRIIGQSRRIAGPLRITAPTSFGRMHVAPLLPDFLARFPDVELHLDLDDQYRDLVGHHYDCAIRIAADVGSSLHAHLLARSRRILCAAPAYIARHGQPETLDELAHHRLLAADGQLPWHLEDRNGSIVLEGTSLVRTNSSEVVRELAIGGCGIALRSIWDVMTALRDGSLVRILPNHAGSRDVAIYAVHLPSAQVPATTQALVTFLAQRFANDPDFGSAGPELSQIWSE